MTGELNTSRNNSATAIVTLQMSHAWD